MAKLIRNTGNVFDGFGFGGVSVPERETFYDKSMNRLNSLVERDSTLQRLRDISCQLMLADRQQEELINYVSSFINNFDFVTGYDYTYQGLNVQYVGNEGLKVKPSGVRPIIKDVFPCQGSFYKVPVMARHEGFWVSLNHDLGGVPIIPFGQHFGNTGNDWNIPKGAYWIGFLSDVRISGRISFGGTVTESSAPLPFEVSLRPYTKGVLQERGNGYSIGSDFMKLTDTSPYVSVDGKVYYDLKQLDVVHSLRMITDSLEEVLDEWRFSGDTSFNFVYVGMGIVFG